MRIVKCPGCSADLELPPSSGAGRVVCPYCEMEFTPGGAPRRSRPGGRQNVRGRGYEDEYDERGYGRGGYRKKSDPTPLIIAAIAVVVLGGGLIFFLSQGKKREARIERDRVTNLASKGEAYFQPPQVLPVTGDAYKFFCDYVKGDKITFRRMDYNAQVTYEDSKGAKRPGWSETYSIHGEITNEAVVEREGDFAIHEGTYDIKSFRRGASDHVPTPVAVKMRFKTDGLGKLVPGSFERLDGAVLGEWPALMGERGFGILDGGSHRQGERWGTATLSDRVYDMVQIPGVNLRSLPMVDQGRQGGWYIKTGKPVRSGKKKEWDKREAHLVLRLSAVENRHDRNGRYNGQPAEISAAVQWRGGATYELGKRMISHIEGMGITLEIVIKTHDGWYHWTVSEHLDAQIFKDS